MFILRKRDGKAIGITLNFSSPWRIILKCWHKAIDHERFMEFDFYRYISCTAPLLRTLKCDIEISTLHNYNIILLIFYSYFFFFSRTPVSLKNVQCSPSQRFSGKFDVKFDQRSQITIPVRKRDFDYQSISSEEIKSLEHIRTNINQGQKVTKTNLLSLDMSEY